MVSESDSSLYIPPDFAGEPPTFAGEPHFTCTMIMSSPQVHKKKTEKAFQLSPFLYAVRDSNPGPID